MPSLPPQARARASERARVAAGSRRICVVLNPEAAAVLMVLTEILECTVTEAVEHALVAYRPPD
jgi:hypothetical protein